MNLIAPPLATPLQSKKRLYLPPLIYVKIHFLVGAVVASGKGTGHDSDLWLQCPVPNSSTLAYLICQGNLLQIVDLVPWICLLVGIPRMSRSFLAFRWRGLVGISDHVLGGLWEVDLLVGNGWCYAWDTQAGTTLCSSLILAARQPSSFQYSPKPSSTTITLSRRCGHMSRPCLALSLSRSLCISLHWVAPGDRSKAGSETRATWHSQYHQILNHYIHTCISVGRHLVGVWIGGVWNGHFPESEKYFSEAEISRKFPEIAQRERFYFSKFQAPEFENSEPEKLQFHTPSHSIPPLDSLLFCRNFLCNATGSVTSISVCSW